MVQKFPVEYVHFAATLVGRMALPEDAIRILCNKYEIEEEEARKLMRVARKMLKRWANQPTESAFVESASFYRFVLQSNSRMQDKLAARERLDKLQGVEKPIQREDNIELNADQIIQIVDRMTERFAEKPAS